MTLHIIISILFGAIFGSFSTFVGFRIFNEDKEINILGKRSICCNCKHELNILDLIPVVSFLALKGKCRYCNEKIPYWHFLAEIFMIISFISATIYFEGINQKTTLIWMISWCLITQSIIDFRTMMSSDIIHIITFICSILLSYLSGFSQKHIIIAPFCILTIFILLAIISKKILKKDCIGFGDIKLFVILSPLFQIEKMPMFFGLCGFFGICFYILMIYLNKKYNQTFETKQFPFIPSIFIAFLLAFYF